MRSLAVTAGALALVAAACGGSPRAGATTLATSTRAAKPAPPTPAQAALGLPPLPAGGPVPGYLMIADRNNDRIIVLNPQTKRVVWQFPRPGDVRPGQSFHDPDDAFFAPGWRTITTNEEFNQSIAEIDLRTHRIVWSYGHPTVRGSAPGYLSNPDDLYKLPNGLYQVADIMNCRVLWISRAKKVVRSLGHAGSCGHAPPAGLSSPNGATPLPDGGVLVTEIGGWVDRFSASGKLLYTVRTPTTYPSDAQLLPNGHILVAGYDDPGRVDELTPKGEVVWTFAPTGHWQLDRPSLAVQWPNGKVALVDDWHHRVLVVDKRTKRVVWSYGHLNQPGSAPGYLNKPDGLDLLPAVAGVKAAQKTLVRVVRVGSLPQTVSKAAAVALPGGRLMLLGGLVGNASIDTILAGPPARLRVVGRLPQPTHDAAAAVLGGSVYLFGGGQSVSWPNVVRVDPASGHAVKAPPLDEPLSDLGAAAIGGQAYLVGGYTGAKYASAVLRYLPHGGTKTVARLPVGTRYAGVAAIGRTVYVAGGLTTAGDSSAIYAVTIGGSVRRIGTLPAPEADAGMAALGGELYLVGGRRVLRIDPGSGKVAVAGTLPVSLTDPSVVALGNALVIAGGGTSSVFELRP